MFLCEGFIAIFCAVDAAMKHLCSQARVRKLQSIPDPAEKAERLEQAGMGRARHIRAGGESMHVAETVRLAGMCDTHGRKQ